MPSAGRWSVRRSCARRRLSALPSIHTHGMFESSLVRRSPMARNKYPEETVKKILDVAEGLFMTKGYEHTTMADIVEGLGGLTKGAVYHHFKKQGRGLRGVFARANQTVVARLRGDHGRPEPERSREDPRVRRSVGGGPLGRDVGCHAALFRPPLQSSRILAREYLDVLDGGAPFYRAGPFGRAWRTARSPRTARRGDRSPGRRMRSMRDHPRYGKRAPQRSQVRGTRCHHERQQGVGGHITARLARAVGKYSAHEGDSPT